MTPSTLQASVTKTGAFDGAGLDISAMLTNSVVRIIITVLTAGKRAVFALEDSVDGFNSDIRTLATFHVGGEIKAGSPRQRDFHNWEMPAVRFGVSSATMRLSLLSIDGSASVTYGGFVQPGS